MRLFRILSIVIRFYIFIIIILLQYILKFDMVWIDYRRAFDFKVWRSYANLAKLNLWLNCIYDIQ